jgi:2-keto-4-pentenoate hydratase/2-oxohepta-3-ene-1,7-dioic acid hydratase in catechol pathway
MGDELVDFLAARPAWPRSWRALLGAGLVLGADGTPSRELGVAAEEARKSSASRIPIGAARLGPPIPDPTKIVAIGLNYRDHALEQKKEPPEAPLLFAKAPSCLVGPRDPIRLPDPAIEDRVDSEAELCVVLARPARNVSEADAMECVLGYTVMNDVSGRKAQYGDRQWFRGKSFDTFGPCGPWIVTRDELPDPSGLALEADWGGRPMQRGNTRDLIFSVPALISYVSRMMTLLPGDLITTGTPAGVGVFRDPPAFLQRGETVTVRLEKVGEIANPVE